MLSSCCTKMNMLAVFAVLLQAFVWQALSKDIPAFVHLCKRNDPELPKCFVKTLNELIPYIVKGIPEMDVPPGDPLQFPSISVDTGDSPTIQLQANLTNGMITGLQNIDMNRFDLDLDKGRFSATAKFTHVRIQGDYKMRGKLLLLKIDDSGKLDFNATGVTANVEWYGSFYMKNEQQYLTFDKIEYKLAFEDMHVLFESSDPGHKTVAQAFSQGLNEDKRAMKELVGPMIETALGEVSLDYFNRVYRLFPMDQLYPRE